ncbi:MAG: ATP-dependent metallopeptidase FtsH/Yme1/Tma family protein, partial [Cypionkella sp.]
MGNARNIAFWVIMFMLLLAVFQFFGGNSAANRATDTVSYSEFIARVEAGEVQSVTLNGENVAFQAADGKVFSTIAPEDTSLTQRLIDNNVQVVAKSQTP